jgi:uncharacterized membrane protein
MHFRTWRERAMQALLFELGGIALATPIYGLIFGATPAEGLLLVSAMALAALICAPLHNAAFDRIEWHRTSRLASARPLSTRCLHAVTHEATLMAVTLPLIILIGGHGLWEAVLLDLGFTAFYAGYALVFYWAYDLARPLAVAS